MARHANSLSVLVIEEDTSALALIAGICTSNGLRVLLARTPDEALSIAERGFVPIDLVLADELLGGESGESAVARIRQIRPEVRSLYMRAGVDSDVIRIAVRKSSEPGTADDGGLVQSIRAACAGPLRRASGSSGGI